ncbi:MAG: hypothetical protein RBU45_04460 [Myxococcota bacterium]|jgi:hypothetical protein|nr:hypothetical protein [Myxococcota bacterium]
MPEENVLALERLVSRRRALSQVLLSLDAYERWGHGSDPAFERQAQGAGAEKERVTRELGARVASLRLAEPDAVARWAMAHVRIIDAFLAGATERQRTEAYVAEQERTAWLELLAGARDFVAQNPAFDTADPAAYRAEFGFDRP